MGFLRFNALYERAVRDVSPGRLTSREVRSLLQEAARTVDEVSSGKAHAWDIPNVENTFRSLYEAVRRDQLRPPHFEADPKAFESLYRLMHLKPQSGIAGADGFLDSAQQVLNDKGPWPKLAAEVVPFGAQIARTQAPRFLRDPKWFENLVDFGRGNGINGTGIRLKGGYALTARHVSDFPPSLNQGPKQAFQGHLDYSALLPGAVLRVSPAKGAVPEVLGSRLDYRPGSFGRHNDWALLSVPGTQAQGLPLRRTSTLKPHERVFIVGDKTGPVFRVSSGTLGKTVGHNAVIEGAEVEGGFSGSPVVDEQGSLVGIVYARKGLDSALMVTTDAILEELARARKKDPSLPDWEPQ